jgi:hypothetical protein
MASVWGSADARAKAFAEHQEIPAWEAHWLPGFLSGS